MRTVLPVSNIDKARYAAELLHGARFKDAERVLKGVLRDDPGQVEALTYYGVLCGMRGDVAEAVKHLSRAVKRKPDADAALYNLGQALIRLGRQDEAIPHLERAAQIAPTPQVYEKLGDCLRRAGRLDEAVVQYVRAVDLAGTGAGAMLLSSLVETRRTICDWPDLESQGVRLLQRVAAGEPVEPLLLHYVSDDAALARKNAVAYWRTFLKPTFPPALMERRVAHKSSGASARIRLAYLCADFRNHATAHLIAEMVERHDRARFETFALSYGQDDGSILRRRLEAGFEHFVDLERRTSLDIARKIESLGIDILVDLNGFIARSRPEILAARAAPVQCHYLAFPGTLGTDVIDYHIVDPVIAPPGDEPHFTEALARLPDCYQANDGRREISARRPTRAECGLPATGVVLCSFNNAIKITPVMFDIWMRVLHAAPASVLWLFADNRWVGDNLRREAERRGIDSGRLVLAGYATPGDHLARLALADLFLDTQPYGAHTTASDALWMSVPVLTIAGNSFAARAGASIVKAAGIPELVMPSREAYEREAIVLARSPERLAALKARLAGLRSTCRLFDTARFTRHIEAAYAEMWTRRQRGERPRSFDVEPLP